MQREERGERREKVERDGLGSERERERDRAKQAQGRGPQAGSEHSTLQRSEAKRRRHKHKCSSASPCFFFPFLLSEARGRRGRPFFRVRRHCPPRAPRRADVRNRTALTRSARPASGAPDGVALALALALALPAAAEEAVEPCQECKA